MTSLSTHVLDLAHGCPAQGMALTLTLALTGGGTLLAEGATDADGRWPALQGLTLAPGRYAIGFAVAGYFRARGIALPDPPFLDVVTVDFGMAAAGHYHVPLLVSPFGFSTYRGS